MTRTADAIIIGAGVIGTNIALELNRKGIRSISIDSNPASGHGSTGASCAIIRVHYSTLDGTAFAYEGYHYWRDWADYLGVKDERGLAEFREIVSGRKTFSGTSDDHRVDTIIVIRFPEGLVQLDLELHGKRVAFLGSIERNSRPPLLDFIQDRLKFAHGCSLSSPVRKEARPFDGRIAGSKSTSC